MSERPSIFKSEWDSESNSKYKTAKELTKLIREAKRECYPGIPELDDVLYVEDDSGLCAIDPNGMDWLELSLLVMNKIIVLPGAAKRQLTDLHIHIPEKQQMH